MRATSSRQLSPAAIKALLREENRLRLCDETMTVYDRAREQGIDAFVVPELIQKEVAKRFGMREEVAVEAMRCAETLPQMSAEDVREAIEISHYRKYNRCQDGSLEVGGEVPLNIELWRLPLPMDSSAPLESTSLSHIQHVSGGPLVVMAASYS